MKVSESWLREHVEVDAATEELIEQLTMAGLEVDAVEPAAANFSGVLVGEITSAEKHPDADKLKVCTVQGANNEAFNVVCGAPNARVGLKVPFATVGATLPGDFTIKKAKLRGVESFGMLCSASELGLSDDSDGLFELPTSAETGANVRDYLQLDDNLIEVDLTPNRGDCLSIIGLTREIAVLNNTTSTWTRIEALPANIAGEVAGDIKDTFNVSLTAGSACPRYAGRVVRGINPSAETPLWMQEKLRRSGIRSIHPVVDITNFVMLELGQPLHGFDLAKLNVAIEVRYARSDESITLLDGAELKLDTETLVIADGQQALAIAGIMGGQHSGVSDDTVDIFFESAHFNPLTIAGKARQYGLHTDSSHRFERGVDPELPMIALERATQLLQEIAGGKAGPAVCTELADELPPRLNVTLRAAQIKRLLKLEIASDRILTILNSLGLQLLNTAGEAGDETWHFQIPFWRFDLSIEADLIEEIARIYGYNKLPKSQLTLAPEIKASAPNPLNPIRATLVNRGYQEAITYSFIAPQLQQLFNPGQEAVAITNPISADMAVMRTSLWPGLLSALQYNINRQQSRVRLFETGLRFASHAAGEQWPTVAGVITGKRSSENWNNTTEDVDFYDIKGDVEALLTAIGVADKVEHIVGNLDALHPGQTLEIKFNQEKIVGYIGKLNPVIQKALDLDQPVFLFELYLEHLRANPVDQLSQISRFPEVRRDIAVVVDQQISVSDLTAIVRANSGEYLTELKVFDVYQGKGVEKHSKSIGLGLTFQNKSRTLSDHEVNTAEETVIRALEDQFGASLRR
ncbi:MAG: phenylalanine--tRNA ligase subunit beta [Porticoccaceae bacterium]